MKKILDCDHNQYMNHSLEVFKEIRGHNFLTIIEFKVRQAALIQSKQVMRNKYTDKRLIDYNSQAQMKLKNRIYEFDGRGIFEY